VHLEPFIDFRLAKADHAPEPEAGQPTGLEPIEDRRHPEHLGELGGGQEASLTR
jgi:hypothetical protein